MINKERLAVGEILATCWGYEQTNWNFYQIVRMTDKSIWIQQIGAKSKECGYMMYELEPIKDDFIEDSKIIRKTISNYMKLNGFQYLSHYTKGRVVLETNYY